MGSGNAKLLSVGRGGVTAYEGKGTTISGYIGHNWLDDIGPETIGLDTRTVSDDDIWRVAVCGPILDVDLPAGSISRPFENRVEQYKGNARSLDAVSLDVWIELYCAAGAVVHRGPDAVAAFAKSLSSRNY